MNNPTDEQITERIARFCGWEPDHWNMPWGERLLWWTNKESGDVTTFCSLPSFTSSIDALRPVMEKLSEDQWGNLCQKLQSKAKAGVRTMAEHYLTIPPETLARAIYGAIGK